LGRPELRADRPTRWPGSRMLSVYTLPRIVTHIPVSLRPGARPLTMNASWAVAAPVPDVLR
jgi:hypothetical protein